jgi:hypothetical protein
VETPPYVLVIVWVSIHAGGLLIAWGTRVAAGSRCEIPMQLACFLAMTAIGGSAWVCGQLGLGFWIPSGITLIAMVLTAVLDFHPSHELHPAIHAPAHR